MTKDQYSVQLIKPPFVESLKQKIFKMVGLSFKVQLTSAIDSPVTEAYNVFTNGLFKIDDGTAGIGIYVSGTNQSIKFGHPWKDWDTTKMSESLEIELGAIGFAACAMIEHPIQNGDIHIFTACQPAVIQLQTWLKGGLKLCVLATAAGEMLDKLAKDNTNTVTVHWIQGENEYLKIADTLSEKGREGEEFIEGDFKHFELCKTYETTSSTDEKAKCEATSDNESLAKAILFLGQIEDSIKIEEEIVEQKRKKIEADFNSMEARLKEAEHENRMWCVFSATFAVVFASIVYYYQKGKW